MLFVESIVTDSFENELQERAFLFTWELSEHITHDVIDGNAVYVKEALDNVFENAYDMSYAYVVDFEGKVFSHTFAGGFPRALFNAVEDESGNSPCISIQRYNFDGVPILDICVPLIEGMEAHIHTGMDLTYVNSQLDSIRNTIMLISIAIAFTGIIIGLAISRHITNPLNRLTGRISALGEVGTLEEIVMPDSGVEVVEFTNAFNRMVAERMKAEEKIHNSLKEKEVLLKEIHHRVKNNMAVISSLLSLQSNYIDDEKSLSLFRESQGRIRSMALVHEKLYQSEDFAHIDVRDYVSSLVRNVKSSFMGIKEVSTDINVEAMDLDIDNLIPCGLIINELLTNAYKHAFDGTDSPEISISMAKVDEDNVCLEIRDNGNKLPEGFDISRSKGLGLKLVRALATQLDGKLEVTGDNGTTFRLTFPEKLELVM